VNIIVLNRKTLIVYLRSKADQFEFNSKNKI
jgi:hypothetical protein